MGFATEFLFVAVVVMWGRRWCLAQGFALCECKWFWVCVCVLAEGIFLSTQGLMLFTQS